MEQRSEIRRWVITWLKGEISQEDRRCLEKWLSENPANREWFNRYVKKEHLIKSLQIYSSFDTDKRWNALERQLIPRSGHFMMRWIWTYAAVVMVLFMSGVAYWWLHVDEPEQVVMAGLSKEDRKQAVLIMENGEQVVLDGIKDTCVVLSKKEVLNINKQGNLVYLADSSVKRQQQRWHTLRIPRGGEYKLILDDSTQVWLNSATEITFPIHFTGNERKVKLSGEAYFQVAENKECPFIVEFGGQQVQVLGTSFDIMAYLDEDCFYTTLLHGSVMVTGGEDNKILVPGEQALFDGKTLSVKKVNAGLYCSWIRDRFVFASENLETVSRKLERWYDVSFFFSDESMKAELFTGSIPKYSDLERVLKMLEMTTPIRFKQQGRTVTVESIR